MLRVVEAFLRIYLDLGGRLLRSVESPVPKCETGAA
jgi:hypothetical protein